MSWVERILGRFGGNRTQREWRKQMGGPPGERWFIPSETPLVTMVFLAACVALYIVTVQQSVDPVAGGGGGGIFGPKPSNAALLRYGASNPVLIQQLDQWWVGSSRVDLQACKLEYSIVSPK